MSPNALSTPTHPRLLFTNKKDLYSVLLTWVIAVIFVASVVISAIHYPRLFLLGSATVAHGILNVFTDIMVPQLVAESIYWEAPQYEAIQVSYLPRSALDVPDREQAWYMWAANGYRSGGWQWQIPGYSKDIAVLTVMMQNVRKGGPRTSAGSFTFLLYLLLISLKPHVQNKVTEQPC
ncbi:uncharacterized protein EV420DRAFT_702121 [Desarmillaria tabescens]|uniref:Uncharacterized protein n=1 Tax=Armillaria tabescens TaxID=1929756 RepID=A0AA39MYW7_ARMTA|nr:uncharacterized protein EV420DRAFT_702121 [Desarmillaria tabescens]KAK0451996.1 hypothetical protein EV420DRAFT_702121 [Desarmillaria tabescens]